MSLINIYTIDIYFISTKKKEEEKEQTNQTFNEITNINIQILITKRLRQFKKERKNKEERERIAL